MISVPAASLRTDETKHAVAVIGAGPAGLFTARALRAAGFPYVIFEAAHPGAGAGGNPAGLVKPFLGQPHDPPYRFYRAAFCEAERVYAGMPECAARARAADVRASLIVHAAREDASFARARPTSKREFAEAGVASGEGGGVMFEGAFVVKAAALMQAAAADLGGYVAAEVVGLEAARQGIVIHTRCGAVLPFAAAVCCAGAGVLSLISDLAVFPAKGQVTVLPASAFARVPAFPVSGDGYVLPLDDGGVLLGATSEKGVDDSCVTLQADAANLLRCRGVLTDAVSDVPPLFSRASVRMVARKRRPRVAPCAIPRVYVNAGHGARGLSSGPICGLLAAAWVARDVRGAPFPEALREAAALCADSIEL